MPAGEFDEQIPRQLPLVLAAYNAGEGAVDRAGRRVPNIAETREYVRRGMSLMRGRAA